jgi:hypothetical protein
MVHPNDCRARLAEVAENHHFWLKTAGRAEIALVATEYLYKSIENK